MQVLCRKRKAHRWEYVGGEVFVGLGLIAMVLVGSLLPLDAELFYIHLTIGLNDRKKITDVRIKAGKEAIDYKGDFCCRKG